MTVRVYRFDGTVDEFKACSGIILSDREPFYYHLVFLWKCDVRIPFQEVNAIDLESSEVNHARIKKT